MSCAGASRRGPSPPLISEVGSSEGPGSYRWTPDPVNPCCIRLSFVLPTRPATAYRRLRATTSERRGRAR